MHEAPRKRTNHPLGARVLCKERHPLSAPQEAAAGNSTRSALTEAVRPRQPSTRGGPSQKSRDVTITFRVILEFYTNCVLRRSSGGLLDSPSQGLSSAEAARSRAALDGFRPSNDDRLRLSIGSSIRFYARVAAGARG